MKKKRTEKPNLKRRANDDINKHPNISDNCHNAHTPCCDLIREIVTEIFPQIAAAEATDDVNDGKSKLTEQVEPVKEQPLLGFMIQKYLMKQYQSRWGNGKNNASNQQGGSELKSSKKKKKKKKKPSNKVESNRNDNGLVAKENDQTYAAIQETDVGYEQTVNDGNRSFNEANSTTLPQTDDLEPFAIPSSLDCFLQTISDINSAQSTDKTKANRDLVCFVSYLTRKYETFLEEKRRDPQKKDKKKDNVDLMDIVPTIRIDDLKSHAGNIGCRLCQTSVNSRLKSLLYDINAINNSLPWGMNGEPLSRKGAVFAIDDQSIVINKQRSLALDSYDEDRAFDYVNMDDDFDLEAGNTMSSTTDCTPLFRLELHPISPPAAENEEGLRYLQLKSVSGEYPFTLDYIIKLIQFVILPGGIELKETSTSSNELTEEDFESIQDSVFRMCRKYRLTFDELQARTTRMLTKYKEAETNNSNRSAFDSNSPQSMNSCNSDCELILKNAADFLITLTKMVCLVGWTSEYGPYLVECIVDCWDQFNATLAKLICPTMKYRGGVLQLCKRPGCIPLMASNKMMRDRFLEYLSVKTTLIDKFVTFLDERLINPTHKSYRGNVHQATSPLVRLCILDVYMSHLCKSQNASIPNIFPSENDENEFITLLDARITLAQDVIKSATKDNIEAKEMKDFSKVKMLYASIITIVDGKDSEYKNSPGFIKQYHDRSVAEREKAERELQYEPEKLTPDLITAVMNTSQWLTMQWIYMLIMRQSYHSPIIFALPRCLGDWMESIPGSEIPSFDEILPATPIDNEPTRCTGQEAKRRLSGVLSALLYRWLETRCFEWHAELTQNELLTAVDLDDFAVNDKGAKSSKKKKSKKKASNGDKLSNTQKELSANCADSYLKNNGGESEICLSTVIQETNETELTLDSSTDAVGDVTESSGKNNETHISCCDDDTLLRTADNSSFTSTTNANEEISHRSLVDKPQIQNELPISFNNKKNKKTRLAANGGKDNVNTNGSKPIDLKVTPDNSCSTDSRKSVDNNLTKSIDNQAAVTDGTDTIDQSSNNSVVSIKMTKPANNNFELNLAKKKTRSRKKTNSTKNDAQTTTPAELSHQKPVSKHINQAVNEVNSADSIHPFQEEVKSSKETKQYCNRKDQSNVPSATIPAPEVTVELNTAKSHTAFTELSNAEPSIGVIDDNGEFISAEDFLVGRMEALLAEIEAIKSRYTLWF